MAVTKTTTRKTAAKTTAKRATPRKPAPRAAAKSAPRAVKATAKTSTIKSGSNELRTQIDKLKDQLQKTLTKEITSLTGAIAKEKKRIASNLSKSKKAADRVKAAREAYRTKPTVAAKTRYAKARDAAKQVKDELAEIRSVSRALADQLAAAKASERREKKLAGAIDKLTAVIDKPKKSPGRKKGAGKVGRPRKTTRARSTKAVSAPAKPAAKTEVADPAETTGQ